MTSTSTSISFPAFSRGVLACLALCCFSAAPLIAQSIAQSTARSDAPPSQAQGASPAQSIAPSQSTLETPAPAAGQESQPPTVVIRQTVRRVIVDVMVRDSNGKPVHGLTADDFSITEDKQPQRTLSFDVYDFDKPSISRGPNAPPLPPNVFVNVPATPERGPLYVMLYDMVNTQIEDQMTGRQQVLKFINSKPEGTRFAIFVNSDELALAQGFTDDKNQLHAALDGKTHRRHVPNIFLYGANYGRGNPLVIVNVLTRIGNFLDGIPGRKNLIWVAGAFPVDLFPQEGDPVNVQDQVKAETDALAQAQIAVFPVNVRGVVINPEGALTGATPNGGAATVSTAPGAPAPSAINNPTSNPVLAGMRAAGTGGSLNRDYATQEAVADATGGRSFYSTNDVAGALEDATEQGGNFYTLTYSPPDRSDDEKCHNIRVKLNKGNYQLSYRRSYCRVPLVSAAADESGESGPAALAVPLQAGDVLQANMKQGAPMVHDLMFSAHVRTQGAATLATPAQMEQLQSQSAFFRTHRRNQPVKPLPPVKLQAYTIDYRVLDPQFKAQAARSENPPTLEFAVAAFDEDGKTLNGTVNDATPEASQSAENKNGLFRARQSLVVPVSAKSIRVGVRDRTSDRMGTLEVPLPLAPEPTSQAAKQAH
jgi:VWFA-related protein